MSLLNAMMEKFQFVEKTRISDGAGGFETAYIDGDSFNAVITMDTTMEARLAEKQGVSSVYTVTTPRSVVLDYHDIIKRVSDSRYFRITSEGADKYSPSVSSLDMRQVTAEKWEVPR